jgi:ABC-type lipoprotein export system ATPase subunit
LTAALSARALTRRHGDREVVSGVSLEMAAGEWLSLVGPSGSGKTSLLFLLGLLDQPSSGEVLIAGERASSLGAEAQAHLRASHLGFVFQQNNLFEGLSARDNVALPAWKATGSRRRAEARADALLDRLGLAARARDRAGQLSVGEMQRVAIARALVNEPRVVLADEPTGSLDSASAALVLAALAEVTRAGAALLVVTHDPEVAARGARLLPMRDGRLEAP